MKNATKYADELKSLHRKLAREHEPTPRNPLEPLAALVRGALSYDVSEQKADAAMAAIEREFVDLNELRVATELELATLFGERYPQIGQRVTMMTTAMNQIFEREHTMSLDRLKTIKKAEARQFLRELPDLHPFVEAYIMLYALEGNAYPIDNESLAFLVDRVGLPGEASLADVQKLVESAIKAEEMHDFFTAARAAAHDAGKVKRKTKA